MGDGILGNVNDGWFAQLSHGCESFSRGTLNLVSCGNGWGDRLYGTMDNVVSTQVNNMNQAAINNALQHGATQQQALQAGSAEMDRLANPQNMGDLGHLLGTGVSTSWQTVKEVATGAVSTDAAGALIPLLIGAGVVGGAYLLADNASGSEKAPRRRRASRDAA